MAYQGHYREILLNADLLAMRKAKPKLEGEPLRLLILRTCTVEPLLPWLKLAMADWGLALQVELAPFGDCSLPATDKKYDAALLWWRIEDLAPDLILKAYRLGDTGRRSLGESLQLRIEQHLAELAQGLGVPLWITAFDIPTWGADVHATGKIKDDLAIWVYTLNLFVLKKIVENSHLHWWSKELWPHLGLADGYVDGRMDLLGRVPLSAAAMGRWALGFAEQLQALRVPRRKVCVVDADNTLWGGILGEDGLTGLKLGLDFPGSVFHRLQQRLLELKASGLLLVLLSKNDEVAVLEMLAQHPECPLKVADFIALRCNYDDKAQNLLSVAKELDLHPSSFAFLDDQAYEREQMSQTLPEVLILNQSSEPLDMLKSLDHPELRPLFITEEDRQKHLQYRQQQERKILEQQPMARSDFLKSLQLQVKISKLTPSLLPRAVQLLAKTNQFNLTTRRHGEAQLQAWLNQPEITIHLIHVQDRFGEQGWSGLWMAKKENNQFLVDSFLLSCRVLGRGLEKVLWRDLLLEAQKQNVHSILASYRPTERNHLVADFWSQCQMERVEKKPDGEALNIECNKFENSPNFPNDQGEQFYRLLVSPEDLPCPSHIAILENL